MIRWSETKKGVSFSFLAKGEQNKFVRILEEIGLLLLLQLSDIIILISEISKPGEGMAFAAAYLNIWFPGIDSIISKNSDKRSCQSFLIETLAFINLIVFL